MLVVVDRNKIDTIIVSILYGSNFRVVLNPYFFYLSNFLVVSLLPFQHAS